MSALSDQVVQVLRGGEAGKINFTIGAVKITGGDFGKVADEIELGCVKVHHDQRGEFVPAGSARYISNGKTSTVPGSKAYLPGDSMILGFGSLRTLDDKSLIVHEAVHAINDLFMVTMRGIDDEVAGYVAQALYYRRAGFTGVPIADDALIQDVYKAAFAYADGIIAGKSSFSLVGEESKLGLAIVKVPEYKGLATGAKGWYGGVAHIRAGAH
jgi:hypothetical protein